MTSKLHSNYHDPDLIIDVIKHQLFELKLEFIDLYLIHSPWGHVPASAEVLEHFGTQNLYIDNKPVIRDFDHRLVWAKLEHAVDLGLVKFIGVSNFDECQIDHIVKQCKIKKCLQLTLRGVEP